MNEALAPSLPMGRVARAYLVNARYETVSALRNAGFAPP